jgi:hypothetical protein
LDIEALSFYGGQTGDVLKRNPSPPRFWFAQMKLILKFYEVRDLGSKVAQTVMRKIKNG